MENIRCEGSNICYSDQGQGEVIVLLHGFCGSSAYFEQVIPYLSGSYRVIAPDLRGHGASDAPLGAYNIDQMADDVLSLLNSLEIEKAYLLGHSMGGYVTLSFAQRYASRLKGFGLIHSTGYPDSEEAREKRLKSVSTIQNEGITAFVDALIPGLFAVDAAPQLLERAKEIGYKTPPQGAAGAALAMRERPDRRDVISAAAVPVLLVAGTEDSLVPAERIFTSDKANITKAAISGAGHMSMYEAPERLAEIIKDFVQVPAAKK
ncbi:alpha/beta hydrolase [Paenibacillus sp. FSL R7-0273]|uniref:alpha/beta fold hydrolase n=1 Tax=Paenibacillus sp. FSL R7-0273 TaxID=1536772 RepID=UPI0004F7BA33|nr:alpha/beta hydrolase [Paenibacillus sp. FSL R7-0273]AIQ49379.1 alpha/beta hydrolase [Paenibacillus sp. FSL R7-0273]OMF85313.1 alpha/beta hydrolase [Paenibacillus sp. FSL R7-0273]